MTKLSYSALQTFRTCPLQYKYAYRDRLPVAQSSAMYFGTLLHKVMEELYATTLLPISKEELTHILTTKWQKYLYKDKTQEKSDFAEALAIVNREWERAQEEKNTYTVELEKRFTFNIGNDCEVTGRIDRIDRISEQAVEIIDYKTRRSAPAESEMNDNLQLVVYYLALKTIWPDISDIKLTLNYLRPDIKVSFVPEADFQKKAQKNLMALVAELQASDFAPKPGYYCNKCSYRKICPAMKDQSINPVGGGDIIATSAV